ncbi:TPA: major capsid protein, partial [Pseudomonas aeruginosa]|nr:major capsid protein [Pseudomonas aeruginosa]HEJ5448848.1 major capsid protein [Pseudomonas aeruginosa]
VILAVAGLIYSMLRKA